MNRDQKLRTLYVADMQMLIAELEKVEARYGQTGHIPAAATDSGESGTGELKRLLHSLKYLALYYGDGFACGQVSILEDLVGASADLVADNVDKIRELKLALKKDLAENASANFPDPETDAKLQARFSGQGGQNNQGIQCSQNDQSIQGGKNNQGIQGSQNNQGGQGGTIRDTASHIPRPVGAANDAGDHGGYGETGSTFSVRCRLSELEELPWPRIYVLLNSIRNQGVLFFIDPPVDQLKERAVAPGSWLHLGLSSTLSAEQLAGQLKSAGLNEISVFSGTAVAGESGERTCELNSIIRLVRLSRLQEDPPTLAQRLLDEAFDLSTRAGNAGTDISQFLDQYLASICSSSGFRPPELICEINSFLVGNCAMHTRMQVLIHLINNSLSHCRGEETKIFVSLKLLEGDVPSRDILELVYRDSGGWYAVDGSALNSGDNTSGGLGREAENPGISGRGLGLDIIRKQAEKLHAELKMPPVFPGPFMLRWARESHEIHVDRFETDGGNLVDVPSAVIEAIRDFSHTRLIERRAGEFFYQIRERAFRVGSVLPQPATRIHAVLYRVPGGESEVLITGRHRFKKKIIFPATRRFEVPGMVELSN